MEVKFCINVEEDSFELLHHLEESLRRKRSITYNHVQGCHGNVQGSCPDGMGCGSSSHKCTGQSCTLNKCKQLAENNNADGFAYRRSANQYCRLCSFAELITYKSEIDYGIYSSVPSKYRQMNLKMISVILLYALINY